MVLYVVDLDGTLADIRERLAKAGKEPGRGDRAAFQAWLDRIQNHETLAKDSVVPGMLQLVLALDAAHLPIVYVTGRCEKYRDVTTRWLADHHFPYAALIMRGNGDERLAAEYKEEAILRLLQMHNATEVVAIDDDGGGDCSQMYLGNGWTHLQVKV